MKNLLSYLLFSGVILLVGCTTKQPKAPAISKGTLDLSTWSFDHNHFVTLDGQWFFYWKKLLSPQDIGKRQLPPYTLVDVPNSWTNYQVNQVKLPPHGYATYCLRIKLPNTNKPLGIFIPKIWSASKVWLNDSLVYTSGKVGRQYKSYESQILEQLVEFSAPSQEVHLVVQVANHDMFIGGLIQSFRLGIYSEILESNSLAYSWTLMWLGVLLVMGVYHFVLFFFRQKNKSTLYFGIICLFIGLRLIVFGEHYIYEYLKEHSGWLTFAIQSKAYYITTFFLPPVALLYVRSLYPEEVRFFKWQIFIVSPQVIKVSLWVTTVYSVFILVVSPVVFTPTIFFYQPFMGLFVAYLFFAIVLAGVHKKRESAFQMAGIFTMVLAGVNDGLLALGALELLPVAFAIFLSLQFLVIARRFSRAFKSVEELSTNLEKKVEERTKELEDKTKQLEKKNRSITDSIQYANRIQKAVLGSQQHIEKQFKDAFIYLKARDIVSGDFYWFSETNCNQSWLYNTNMNGGLEHANPDLPIVKLKIIIAADCTGHGVPGAFMTIMGNDLLNEIIDNECIHKPDVILKELDKRVRATLHNETQEKADDGMDMTVVTIDETHQKLYFSGAKNSILLVRRGEVFRLKGSIYPIGSEHYKAEREYALHVFETQPNDIIYMYSDGFQDQFGGKKGRKYMSKKFRQFLLSLSHLPMEEQRYKINEELKTWMGDHYQQTDDVLVMGVKL
ncbi:PP2C family protein-serine/threonine phosphatase [Microscilla marina]|uniref:Serine/threonine protein kinases n=1 Tax=Microscilla marina ATCC 23134 TaxID=313606 RepID=A1ZV19_MICM2|nr:7TM diverse intracellular signaling domain-containing protein [Microscilla marina]EAY25797.1 serine/threonine protein kinases [Microscilla marina ATCC 23134]